MVKATGVGRGNNPRSHMNRPSGPDHPRWSDDRMIAETGYVKLRVGKGHPLADPNGYAYEHLVVWVSAGNSRPKPGWVLHHKNEVKTDNRLSNLELKLKERHGVEHFDNYLTDEQIVKIRELYHSGEETTVSLARLYKMPAQRIWLYVRGKSRRSAGGPIQAEGKYATRRHLLREDASA